MPRRLGSTSRCEGCRRLGRAAPAPAGGTRHLQGGAPTAAGTMGSAAARHAGALHLSQQPDRPSSGLHQPHGHFPGWHRPIAVRSYHADAGAPADEKARAHWERSFELIDGNVFNGEDLFICEQIQLGLPAAGDAAFVLGRFENNVRRFHETIATSLAGWLSQLRSWKLLASWCDGCRQCRRARRRQAVPLPEACAAWRSCGGEDRQRSRVRRDKEPRAPGTTGFLDNAETERFFRVRQPAHDR